jgi:hypothetical protein
MRRPKHVGGYKAIDSIGWTDKTLGMGGMNASQMFVQQ